MKAISSLAGSSLRHFPASGCHCRLVVVAQGSPICSKGIGFCFLCSGFSLGYPQSGGEKYRPHSSSVPRHPES